MSEEKTTVEAECDNGSLATLPLDSRDPDTLQLIRDRALGSLVEMARWRDLSHALPAFILVGRLADLPEKQIQDDWVNSDHEEMIKLALKKK